VRYVAPEGRQVNVIGAYFSHGQQVGEFQYECLAKLPQRGTKRKSLAERAEPHGVTGAEVGTIDSERFLAFVWRLAGRPAVAAESWRRERPVVIVVDNYSVHKSALVQAALPSLAAAGIVLFYLPSYSPELSAMEPIWHTVKYHDMSQRSFDQLGALKQAVEAALGRKAAALRAAHADTAQLACPHA
jgi:hypothetical protein